MDFLLLYIHAYNPYLISMPLLNNRVVQLLTTV